MNKRKLEKRRKQNKDFQKKKRIIKRESKEIKNGNRNGFSVSYPKPKKVKPKKNKNK